MKIAIISDIHANLQALTKTLELIKEVRVDQTVCLGDIVGYGANPNECLDLTRKHCSMILLGNHDLAAVDLSTAEQFTANARIAAHWTSEQLEPDHKAFLRTLPYVGKQGEALLVHASPFEPEEWHYIFSAVDARWMFDSFSEQICFVGHSHVPGVYAEHSRTKQVSRSDRYIVNVGSVGQPRDGNPKLSFGVFDAEKWEYENVRASYDAEAAGREIINAGLPGALGERLLAGL